MRAVQVHPLLLMVEVIDSKHDMPLFADDDTLICSYIFNYKINMFCFPLL